MPRVDDRSKAGEIYEQAVSLSSSSSVSEEEPPSPLYQTSQIVDIDSQVTKKVVVYRMLRIVLTIASTNFVDQ